MRWLRRDLTFPENERERGATAVLIGILLVVIIGFAGLAVDGAALMAKKQELQNGADAAALAAAQVAAKEDCSGFTCPVAAATAEPYGRDNVRNETASVQTAFEFDTGAKNVKATVTGDQTHWFMSVLGLGSSSLTATATAAWTSPHGGPSMLPLAISACNFYDSAGAPAIGDEIEVWLPKGKLFDEPPVDGCGTLEYPPGGFGWLDYDPITCQSAADLVVGGWAPGDNGADRPECLDADFFKVGKVFLVPIFTAISGQGSSAEFQIDRFAAVKLLGFEFKEGGTDFVEPVLCAGDPPSNSDYRDSCLHVKFEEWVFADGEDYTGGAEDTEVSIVSLIE